MLNRFPLLLLLAAIPFAACGSDEPKPIIIGDNDDQTPDDKKDPPPAQVDFCKENPDDPDCKTFEPDMVIEVSGTINANTTWTAEKKWVLTSKVEVAAGATLTIEPGTLVVGTKSPLGWLQVKQGAKIVAKGTAASPIVFTSARDPGARQSGDWGGVVLLGKARINVTGGTAEGEGGAGTYGGSDDADNSGALEYVRIEFAGWELSPNNELNGLTLYGVGSGTSLHHVQVHYGLDDGIEWFGGAVNGHHLVVSGTDDDCFDWTQGYKGNLQFIFCMHASNRGDRGIEADGNEQDFTATPHSSPVVYNYTFVGRGGASYLANADSRGITLRRGTEGYLYNGVIMNFHNAALDIDDDTSGGANFALANTLVFGNKAPGRDTNAQFDTDSDSIDELAFFNGFANNSFATDPALTAIGDNTFAVAPNPVPAAGSVALSNGATPVNNGFFDTTATYRGAFGATNWLGTWTKFTPN